MTTDSLQLAGDASAILEGHGLVACGRRKNGRTWVDFWTREGVAYRHELIGDETVDEVVAGCLARLPAPTTVDAQRRSSDLS